MKKLVNMLLALFIVFSIAACGTKDDNETAKTAKTDNETEQPATETETPAAEEESVEEETTGTTDQQETEADEPSVLPDEKQLTIYGEVEETKPGKLTKSENGYVIYVLDQYTFTGEEPNKDVIFSNVDDEFFVRIEPIASDANLDTLKENAKTALASIGNVHDINPAEIHDEAFRDAKFYMTGSSSQVSVSYLVKEMDGQLFQFMFHFPQREVAEGITPSFWAMLRSIEVQ